MTGVFPDWRGETAAIVAGGQSAALLAPQLRGRCRIIAVNLAFRLVPDADVLYAADSGFWHHYRDAHDFDGLMLSAADNVHLYCPSVHRVKVLRNRLGDYEPRFQREPVGTIGSGGGNGGAQAVNLAVQFGATTILLAGLDYCGAHWHDDHPNHMRNPSKDQFVRWRAQLDHEAETLRDWGVRVINLSLTSTLRAFPHEHPDSLLPNSRSTALPA